MSSSRITIAIAGGGIGGLCLAAGLTKHAQLDVHVYEAVTDYPDRGTGMVLHGNAISAMELVDPELKKAYFSRAILLASDEEMELATQVILAAGPHRGEVVGHLGRAKGRKTIARTDLLDGWRGLVPPGNIHFEKKLLSIQEQGPQVQLKFEDGTSAVADCLIGADGIHSRTRKYLLGADHPAVSPKNHDQWYAHSRQVPMEEARLLVRDEWTRNVPILCGPDGCMVSLPIRMGEILSCTVTQRAEAGLDQAGPLNEGRFSAYNDDAKAIVELVSRNPGEPWYWQDHDPAPYYYKNNIALIGDAAHATMPFAGNGAGQAIEDAAVLCALFAEVMDPSQTIKALSAFDAVRKGRSQRVVEISREFGRLYSFSLENVGSDPAKMTNYLREMGSFMNDIDIQAQNNEAITLYRASLEETL